MPLPPRLRQFASHFATAGQLSRVDPLLLAAICDRESRGGLVLTPKGPGGKGDGGHGHGLMQIDDRTWAAWLRAHDWRDPATNIAKGAEILRAGLDRFDQDELAALAAYNAGPAAVARALRGFPPASSPARIAALDAVTHGGDYVSDVLRRLALFTNATRETIA